ncbi:universal stress protein [Christiangramia echinicola]|uniref:Universal stress protein n=1 Tax=Christiangramia echinicola TaxID=279359 RepID=A0A1H1RWQ3_9FLAO|nr:universal stress protein [Christiangramia echinicola]SDS40167.1 Nucleotide-binding universal stress protein, UspA family [Christiangramia echinicola]
MKKVLIGVDYNPRSEKVTRDGYELARKLGARVCLIHVLADVSYYGVNYPSFMGYEGYNEMQVDINVISELREVAKNFLNTAAEHLEDPSVETHLADGPTSSTILDYADEWNADLIVLGTHSHSVLEKVLMGTTASRILERTKIPVYLIPVKD